MSSLAQDPQAPIAKHRHDVFNYVLDINDVHLIIAVGNAAKESIVTWCVRGGTCSQGAANVSLCTSEALGPLTKIRPGHAPRCGRARRLGSCNPRRLQEGPGKDQILDGCGPAWLPPDAAGAGCSISPTSTEAPRSFPGLPVRGPIRLGRGGTSSNRKDGQRSIQIFSARGVYNAEGVKLNTLTGGGTRKAIGKNR